MAYRRGGLNNFLENFKFSSKCLLFGNRKKYSYCLVYISLVHSRTKILKNCIVIVDVERVYPQ